ncbi:hypothetical protein KPL35_15295 [Clostridium sp. CF011]|uniref:hypothetical protein n=1 Tax=Clostridium sp. CF011 TaxID=2843318 RepID=UPI001C0B1987|nr:hypothetical protein [Clostridium sp. CF011]MBU3093428.1 hypothetical protein [Clostridium sp. CF011]WAG71273.1 hypothetical protein LL036_07670 [Clostridium sp. CF011]
MTNENKLSKIDISNFQNKEWCKEVLLVNHQLIKKYNKYLTEADQHRVNGVCKYYTQIYIIDESEYFLCSELYDRSRQPFLQWFYKKYNINKKNESSIQNKSKDKTDNLSLVRYNCDELRNINNSLNKPCKVAYLIENLVLIIGLK